MKYENIDEKFVWKVPTKPLDIEKLVKVNSEMRYYHFDVQEINVQDLCKQNDFFDWLFKKHPYRAGLVKMDPNTLYDWHVDHLEGRTMRGVCINAVVTDSPSLVMFSENIEKLASQGGNEWQADIVPFTYEKNEVYIFNPTQSHSVYNFENTRYLFSLQFGENVHRLTYEQLVNEVKTEYVAGK